ncbi:hypothetical protein [Ferrimonas lipolytica]|uniref:Uncharacterized protein n=1 Tax=Ferrimonas lipolytica TaxID=2724191 RepID=A0A6H1UCJ4_9GAMM|nr:hypothetical protein [Ferrimonas lipolytica]QIZ76359.1 hypothetical protein HER31_05495 [Ferrimonas lipolytica]
MNNYFTRYHVLIGASILLLSACGGGGGSGSDPSEVDAGVTTPPVTAPPTTPPPAEDPTTPEPDNSYEPDSERLTNEAESSSELYAAPDFNFDLTRQVNVFLSANDALGEPLTDTIIKMYAVPNNIEAVEDLTAEDSQLIFIGMTNDNGVIDRIVELTPTIQKVMVVVATLGIDNKALLNINEDSLSHHF